MRRLILAAAMVLALPACSTLSGGGPVLVTQATALDEKIAVSVELAYRAARLAMETGVDAGLIKGPRAAQVAAHYNQASSSVQAVRAAYKAGHAPRYATSAVQEHTPVSTLPGALQGQIPSLS